MAGDVCLPGREDDEDMAGGDREDPTDAAPGTILAVGGDGIDVAAGGGVLRVTQIQMPGKKRVDVKEYLKAILLKLERF